MTKVLICGGRDYQNRELVYKILDQFHKENQILEIIEGGALGADIYAAQWSLEHGIKRTTFRADWSKGRSAGPFRNYEMIKKGKPHFVIAFPGGKGTANMISQATINSVLVYIISDKGEIT